MASEREVTIAVGLIGLLLAGSYTATIALGGTRHVPPHWYYLPILLAGLRFGLWGALPTGVLAAVLAGPVTPSDVTSGTPQTTSDWVIRGGFFVVIGATLPAMMRLGTATIQQDRRRLHIEADVRRGLERGEFLTYYQPIVAIDTGRIVGAEALLRWDHPHRGLLTPEAFIADVERIGSLASWVLEEAAITAEHWRSTYHLDNFYIAVNVSAQNLAQPDFVAQVRTALRAAQLEPQCLCVELTESTLIDDIDSVSARLQVLRSLGVQVAVDDFGTGHSPLTYLRHLPIDIIKIDRSFVNELGGQGRSRSIVETLSHLAHELGATCVAEGVETRTHREALIESGYQLAQGYLYAPPLEPMPFEKLLAAGGLLHPVETARGERG